MLRLLKRRSAGLAAVEAGEHETVDTLSCRFDGTTAEYFEIWVVNLLLTICSLGFFRPWAKARKHQYFFSKTSVGKHQLGYWASPKRSMIWAAVTPIVVLAIAVALLYQPVLLLAIVAIIALIYPLYRHHNLVQHAAATGYRGRRFAYVGSVKDSYLRLIVWPVLTVALAFLPLGHSLRSSWGYRFENHSYGKERFAAKLPFSRLWGLVAEMTMTIVAAVSLVMTIAWAVLIAQGGESAVEYFINTLLTGHFRMAHGSVLLAFLIVSVWPLAVWRATSEQLFCAGVQLEAGVSFDTELSSSKLTGLYLVNFVAILLSLGFAIPWATVRVARYRASVTKLICYTDIEELVGDKAAGVMQLKQATARQGVGAELLSALDQGDLDLPRAA